MKFATFKHTGIVTDQPPGELEPTVWTGGLNVKFQEKGTRRAGGTARYFQGSAAPIFAMNLQAGIKNWWIYCGDNRVWVTDGNTHHDITPELGLSTCKAGDWTGTVINGIPVLCNAIDEPIYWDLDTANKCQIIPGWGMGYSCRAIRAYKYHLIALAPRSIIGIEEPHTVWWSSAAPPGAIPAQWEPAPDNDAGDVELSDTQSGIIDGLPLRDLFIVYKRDATYAMQYIGGQLVMAQRKLFLTSGLANKNCVQEIDGQHWVFTGTDVIIHDGNNYRSAVADKVQRALSDGVDPDTVHLSCMIHRFRNNQVWLAIANTGNDRLNVAYSINTKTLDVGIIDLPQVVYLATGLVDKALSVPTWDADAENWDADETAWNTAAYSPSADSVVLCDELNAQVLVSDLTIGTNTLEITSWVERTGLQLDDGIGRNFVTRLIPRLEGKEGDTAYFRVGAAAFFGQPPTWSPPVPFVIGQDIACHVQVEGRLVAVRMDIHTRYDWKLHSYKLEYEPQGLY